MTPPPAGPEGAESSAGKAVPIRVKAQAPIKTERLSRWCMLSSVDKPLKKNAGRTKMLRGFKNSPLGRQPDGHEKEKSPARSAGPFFLCSGENECRPCAQVSL